MVSRNTSSARQPQRSRVRTRKRFPEGAYVAPFKSRAGLPVVVSIWSGGVLYHMAEVREVRGSRRRWFSREDWPAECWMFVPHEERLLARGVYCAPWLEEIAYRTNVPALIAVDRQHRLIATMAVEPGTTEAAVRKALEVVSEPA